MKEVTYKQGMTEIWSDGEKITVNNKSGIKWVETNVDQVLGVGEWKKIQKVAYSELQHPKKSDGNLARAYECVSGYIPQQIFDDLKEELSEEEKKKVALEALRDV